jgi:hypothetical protein
MMRFAGFLTGSATAIALILLVLGIPELHAPDEPPGETVANLPEPQPQPDPAPEPEPELPSEPQPVVVAMPTPVSEPEPELLETHWHSFWSPFGSRIAATGFVSRLESVTGFDYRVVKIDNGVYEVAFAYSDDTERDAMLTAIASATGLDLPDS